MNEKNLEIRRQALATYVRFCEAVYAANSSDFAAVQRILAKKEMFETNTETLCSLEGDLAVWAAENSVIRTGIMNYLAERTMALAEDRTATAFPQDIARIRDMDDRQLRQYIADETEKIKYTRKMRGNNHE